MPLLKVKWCPKSSHPRKPCLIAFHRGKQACFLCHFFFWMFSIGTPTTLLCKLIKSGMRRMKGMCAADFFPFFSSVKSSKEVNQMLPFLSKNNNNLFTSCAYAKCFTLPISNVRIYRPPSCSWPSMHCRKIKPAINRFTVLRLWIYAFTFPNWFSILT